MSPARKVAQHDLLPPVAFTPPEEPGPPFTAHQLAAMPFSKAQEALKDQEVAHMNAHFTKDLLEQLDEDIGRVVCAGLEGRQFYWEAYAVCEACSNTGELKGDDGKMYACPGCTGNGPESIVHTDYDGNLIEDEE